MLFFRFTRVRAEAFSLIALAIIMTSAAAMSTAAERPAATLSTLLDRAQIKR